MSLHQCNTSHKTRLVLYGLMAGFIVYVLSPLLVSGFYADDLVNSLLRSELELNKLSLYQYILNTNWEWLHGRGRVFPVGVALGSAVSYALPSVVAYKSFILLMVLINAYLVSRLVELLSGDFFVSCLVVLLLTVLFQFRLYHDPILSYSGLMQIVLAMAFMSMLLFVRYLECRRLVYLVASLVFFNLSLYYYEVGLLLTAVFPIIALAHYQYKISRPVLRATLPYVVSAMFALMIMVLARMLRDQSMAGYAGIELGLSLEKLGGAFLYQLMAALPLSYYAFDPSDLFSNRWRVQFGYVDMLVGAGLVCTYWYVLLHAGYVKKNKALIAIGVAFLLLPALLIAVSSKYQSELRLGLGYLPVYMQYFGVAIVSATIIQTLRYRLNARAELLLRFVVVIALSFVTLLTMQNNKMVVNKANYDQHYRRLAIELALQDGILASLPDGAVVAIDDDYSYDPYKYVKGGFRNWVNGYGWRNAALLYQYTGRRFQVIDLRDGLSQYIDQVQDVYILGVKSYAKDLKIPEGCVTLDLALKIRRDELGRYAFERRFIREYAPHGRCN